MKEMDGKKFGRLVNEVSELIRKVHIGSSLIGEAGSPRFKTDVTPIIKDFISTLDPELIWKARVAFAEGAESINEALGEAADRNPELLLEYFKRFSKMKNPKIGRMNRALENALKLPDDKVLDYKAKAIETKKSLGIKIYRF